MDGDDFFFSLILETFSFQYFFLSLSLSHSQSKGRKKNTLEEGWRQELWSSNSRREKGNREACGSTQTRPQFEPRIPRGHVLDPSSPPYCFAVLCCAVLQFGFGRWLSGSATLLLGRASGCLASWFSGLWCDCSARTRQDQLTCLLEFYVVFGWQRLLPVAC